MAYELYKFLDLPPVPQHIIDSVDLTRLPALPTPDNPMPDLIYNPRYLKNWDGYDYQSAINIRVRHAEYESWARENVCRSLGDPTLMWTMIMDRPAGIKGISSGAHTDTSRDFTMIYLIDLGGDNVKTVFYKEKKQSLLRPPKTYGEVQQDLEILDSVELPLHTWFILDSRVLHSAEGLTRNRVAFQVGFVEHPFHDVWQTYPDPGYRKK